MKKLFIFIIILSINLFSQEEEINHDGKFALQFQISSLVSLRDFQGATFSGKYHFTNCLAIRIGVGASIQNSDGDGYEASEPENFKEYYFTSENSERVVVVRTQIIHYFSLFNDFSLFTGGGPFYSNTKRDYEKHFTDTSTVNSIEKSEGNEYGVDLILGAEWFVNENISISGEYGMSISTGTEEQTREYYYSKLHSKSDVFRLRPAQVRFGLSIYF